MINKSAQDIGQPIDVLLVEPLREPGMIAKSIPHQLNHTMIGVANTDRSVGACLTRLWEHEPPRMAF